MYSARENYYLNAADSILHPAKTGSQTQCQKAAVA